MYKSISDFNKLSIEKIKKYAQRSVGEARHYLKTRLDAVKDCSDVVLSLCQNDSELLEAIQSNFNPQALSSVKDKQTLEYFTTLLLNQANISKKELASLEDHLRKGKPATLFGQSCYVKAKTLIVTQIVKTNYDLGLKYARKTLL